jgi:predicted transcriptional regulator YdeE
MVRLFRRVRMSTNPEIVMRSAATSIVGLSARTSNARERDPATATLGTLWGRFMQRDAAGGRSRAPTYSVYTDYESDVNGAYTVILGHEGSSPEPGLHRVTVVAGRYAVFTSAGPMPDAVLAGWQQVWSYFDRADGPPRAYTTDFELYDPADPTTVRIHVALATDT